MPELPEVEVLVRHLRPLLRGKIIRGVTVRRARVVSPTSPRQLRRKLRGARFVGLSRRGKYLLFELRGAGGQGRVRVLGHLGMTGRMFLSRKNAPLPKHAAVAFSLGRENFVYEDTRYFGRLTLDTSAIGRLGPEPLGDDFNAEHFGIALKGSRQPIKVKLLDQALVAGIGNIYASEALFRARIPPRLAANKLARTQVVGLRRAIREVLAEAIRFGSTMPLSFEDHRGDRLFYFGRTGDGPGYYEERLRVYDRKGEPCVRCGMPIRRIVQAARSTFFCPRCQGAAMRLR